MKFTLPIIVSSLLVIAGVANATNVDLVTGSPEAGQVVVQYQFLNADKQPEGMIATTMLPNQVTLPADAAGIRVLTLQNHSLPTRSEMPGGWFNFPAPGCTWTNGSGHSPVITFSITNHSISCQ